MSCQMKNPSHKKYIKLFALLFLFAAAPCFAPPVKAAAIQNLSCNPQTIEVATAQGFQPVVIPPGRTYDAIGNMKVRYRDREITIDHDMEYVIWDDGTFGPQRRNRTRGGISSNHVMR